MRFLLSKVFSIALLAQPLGAVQHAPVPAPGDPKSLYQQISQATFLVEVHDAAGDRIGLATAFLVAGGRLVTNAHVAGKGKISLRVGPLSVDCRVEAFDHLNDLAILLPAGRLDARPLALADNSPAVGTRVYAVGNPAGLERTFSEGLVSGKREEAGRSLVQITAPISSGSSGGPVVASSGEVIGVAVGTLNAGQNLNFAVPIEAVHRLLSGNRTPSPTESLTSLFTQIDQLRDAQTGLEGDAWVDASNEIRALLYRARDGSARSPESLLTIARKAVSAFQYGVAAEIARPLAQATKTAVTAAEILTEALTTQAFFEEGENRLSTRAEARKYASIVVARKPKPSAADFRRLAYLLEDLPGEKLAAYSYYRQAFTAAGDQDRHGAILFGLFRMSRDLGQDAEAVRWFGELERQADVGQAWWRELAELHFERGRFPDAARAWRHAAEKSNSYEDWCDEGLSHSLADDFATALSVLRKCIAMGSQQEGSEASLGTANRAIATILLRRGVNDQAVVHARQAIALKPQDWLAYYVLASALNKLQRHGEAVQAAQTALRLSDGSSTLVHSELGGAYFDMEQWEQARVAFAKVAELDPTDDSAAYNVALCLTKLGFFRDAAIWYEETLRRSPSHPSKAEILSRIQKLRAP